MSHDYDQGWNDAIIAPTDAELAVIRFVQHLF